VCASQSKREWANYLCPGRVLRKTFEGLLAGDVKGRDYTLDPGALETLVPYQGSLQRIN